MGDAGMFKEPMVTAGGIMPASRIDRRIIGNERLGPISAKLRETFWKKRAAGWHATPIAY